LIPLIFFPRVVTPQAAGPRRLDALAVDAAGAGLGLLAGLLSDPTPQGVMNPLPQTVPTPTMKVVSHRAFRGEIVWQSRPLTAVLQEIEGSVEDLAEVGGSWRPGWHRGW
jgi:hypothetical protein